MKEKLNKLFNLLIDTRDMIESDNEEFVCSTCCKSIDNLNSAINYLAEVINPEDNKSTQSEVCL